MKGGLRRVQSESCGEGKCLLALWVYWPVHLGRLVVGSNSLTMRGPAKRQMVVIGLVSTCPWECMERVPADVPR